MRKYYIVRRAAVTTASMKAVNSVTFEVTECSYQLNGVYSDPVAAMKAIEKAWSEKDLKPVAVLGLSTTIKTLGMTPARWFENAEVISEEEVSAEEAAAFGKRGKRTAE